jgi:hypothetical protein
LESAKIWILPLVYTLSSSYLKNLKFARLGCNFGVEKPGDGERAWK